MHPEGTGSHREPPLQHLRAELSDCSAWNALGAFPYSPWFSDGALQAALGAWAGVLELGINIQLPRLVSVPPKTPLGPFLAQQIIQTLSILYF